MQVYKFFVIINYEAFCYELPRATLTLDRKRKVHGCLYEQHGRESTLSFYFMLHCNENPVYVFLFWDLRGLSPNFHIHVSVSVLYIPRIGPHIFLQA